MSKIALQDGATIDKYVGDAIVMFFGDPTSLGMKNDALACLAIAMPAADAPRCASGCSKRAHRLDTLRS